MAGRGTGTGNLHAAALPDRMNREYSHGQTCYVWIKLGNQDEPALYPCYSHGRKELPANERWIKIVVQKMLRAVNIANLYYTPQEAVDLLNRPGLTIDNIVHRGFQPTLFQPTAKNKITGYQAFLQVNLF